ncbi:caspase-1-B-like [Dendropsophus ebraccatus]|uniref:caspase-1-B-like n=1 Tax=Dendropsophus ebraccatus TaxID=150705 RepID=UPI0038310AFE
MAGKDKLESLRPQLVERCSETLLQQLLDELRPRGVLNAGEVEHIDQNKPERANKCRRLIDMVINKGNKSCNTLLQIITEKDQALSDSLGITAELPLPIQEQNRNNAAPTQAGNASSASSAPVEPPQEKKGQITLQAPVEPPQEQKLQTNQQGITLCSEAEYQKITSEEKERYPIYEKEKRKRQALIICNITFDEEDLKERKGANADIEGMRYLLEGLGYSVQWKINQTAEEMQTTMKNFAAKKQHKDSDSTFLVFMSHGERDIICGTDFNKENVDGRERVTGGLHVDSIFNTFNNINCPGLRDKPKIIIIQACRGHNMSQVWVSDGPQQTPNMQQEDMEDDAMRKIQTERDFSCFYSTTPDTVSYRSPINGSLFIQNLIKVIKEDAHNSSLEDMFQKVQREFKDGRQMPSRDRTTTIKKFFLLPGY